MAQIEEFIGLLHVIAAGDGPLEQQTAAVDKVLERFLRDAGETLGGDRQRVRGWVEKLKQELLKQALPARADRFADLRDHARAQVDNWLRST